MTGQWWEISRNRDQRPHDNGLKIPLIFYMNERYERYLHDLYARDVSDTQMLFMVDW